MNHQVGDLVTRDGTDLHVVIGIIADSGCIGVRCLRAPETGWVAVGGEWIGETADFEAVDPTQTPAP